MEHVEQVLRGDVALGAGDEGTAAHAGQGGFHSGHTLLQRHIGIGKAHAIGVVHVESDLADVGVVLNGGEHPAGVGRVADAGGIGHADLLHADFFRLVNEPFDPVQRHLVPEGRAEDAGQRERDVEILGLPGQLLEGVQRLLDGAAGIAQIVLLAGGEDEVHVVHPGGPGVLHARLFRSGQRR